MQKILYSGEMVEHNFGEEIFDFDSVRWDEFHLSISLQSNNKTKHETCRLVGHRSTPAKVFSNERRMLKIEFE